ncbi:RING-CH-type domain-containing protein [Heracleum sosnowskyi]|uniref:RING-CH-type domain-containing protein n=1 Tax=Heracleum sosnowskyi TaxID=360622 RepID=A0AAD8LXY6_9APIA|nr:RING-CH-type domain-containing protein [Heracleum sosnowskyi]
MDSSEMACFDLERGVGLDSSLPNDDDDEVSICFSEVEEGSCYSQFYSTADGSIDGYTFGSEIDQVLDSRRGSSVAGSDCSVDIQNGVDDFKIFLERMERDCRICHLSLGADENDGESGVAIELGCCCKNDLAAAHQRCAEAWFKIKGNKICEICNSVAQNVVGPSDIESTQQICEANVIPASAVSLPVSSTSESRVFLIGHRFVNILLACIVFAFFLSWLFHFHMPS